MATSSSIDFDRRRSRARWLLSAPARLVVGLAGCVPLIIVLVYSFLAPGDYGGVKWIPSLQGWLQVVMDSDPVDGSLTFSIGNAAILIRSFGLAAITTILCFLLGFPTAYFIATRPISTREGWLLLISVPLWTNLVIRTFAVQNIIAEHGILNTFLLWSGLINQPLQMLDTNAAILIGMAYVYLPLMILPLYSAIEKLDIKILEAASDLYARPLLVLSQVILPLSKSGIIAGCILVFVPAVSAYVTPVLLGGGRQMMIGNFIQLQFGEGQDWPFGAALSMVLLFAIMGALIIYVRNSSANEAEHG